MIKALIYVQYGLTKEIQLFIGSLLVIPGSWPQLIYGPINFFTNGPDLGPCLRNTATNVGQSCSRPNFEGLLLDTPRIRFTATVEQPPRHNITNIFQVFGRKMRHIAKTINNDQGRPAEQIVMVAPRINDRPRINDTLVPGQLPRPTFQARLRRLSWFGQSRSLPSFQGDPDNMHRVRFTVTVNQPVGNNVTDIIQTLRRKIWHVAQMTDDRPGRSPEQFITIAPRVNNAPRISDTLVPAQLPRPTALTKFRRLS